MELVFREINLKNFSDDLHLYFFSDFHIGNINHDSKKLAKHIKIFNKDENALAWILGDNADNRLPDHKYFSFEQVDCKFPMKNFIKNCYKEFESRVIDMNPARIVGIHEGNHDKGNKYGHPYTQEICENHNIPFLGYRAVSTLRIRAGKSNGAACNLTIFTTHGSGGGGKSGSKINKIESEAESTEADIYVQGHNHYLSALPAIKHQVHIYKSTPILREREMYFINAGSYFTSYNVGNYSYAEKKSYKPQHTGCVRLTVSLRNINENKCVLNAELLR